MDDIVRYQYADGPLQVVLAIMEPSPSCNKAGLLRFYQMINYLSPPAKTWMSQFNHSETSSKEVSFNWLEIQDDAFNKEKQLITTATVPMYCNLQTPAVLQADASDEGQGEALPQRSENGKLQPKWLSCPAV